MTERPDDRIRARLRGRSRDERIDPLAGGWAEEIRSLRPPAKLAMLIRQIWEEAGFGDYVPHIDLILREISDQDPTYGWALLEHSRVLPPHPARRAVLWSLFGPLRRTLEMRFLWLLSPFALGSPAERTWILEGYAALASQREGITLGRDDATLVVKALGPDGELPLALWSALHVCWDFAPQLVLDRLERNADTLIMGAPEVLIDLLDQGAEGGRLAPEETQRLRELVIRFVRQVVTVADQPDWSRWRLAVTAVRLGRGDPEWLEGIVKASLPMTGPAADLGVYLAEAQSLYGGED